MRGLFNVRGTLEHVATLVRKLQNDLRNFGVKLMCPGCMMANTDDSGVVVVCGVLCFLQNKMHLET